MAVDLTVDKLLEMRGKPVYDRAGDKIGSIEDIYIDDESRQPEWLGLGTGFLGMKHAVVPLANAGFHDEGIEVPYSKDDVKSAPSVGDDEDISPSQEMELSRHYGLHAEASSSPPISRGDLTDPAGSAGWSPAGQSQSRPAETEGGMRGDRAHLRKYMQR